MEHEETNNAAGEAEKNSQAAQASTIASALAKRGKDKPDDKSGGIAKVKTPPAGEVKGDTDGDDDPAELRKQIKELQETVAKFNPEAMKKTEVLEGKYAKADFIMSRMKSEGMRKIARVMLPDTTDEKQLWESAKEVEKIYQTVVQEWDQFKKDNPGQFRSGTSDGGMTPNEYADEQARNARLNAPATSQIAAALRNRRR